MIKKKRLSGIKVLKISTWVSVIFTFIFVLVVLFFVIFPMLLKVPIETQLSSLTGLDVQLSKITFDFEKKGITLKVHDISIASGEAQQMAMIKNLSWHINLLSLFDDIYHSSQIFIDTLVLYSNLDDFSIDDIRNIASLGMLKELYFFESLHINKTIIKDTVEIASLTLKRDGMQLLLTIPNQSIGTKHLDITIILSSAKINQNGFLTLPITLSGDDFELLSSLKIYSYQGYDFIQFSGLIQRMNVINISDYLPMVLIGDINHQWIKHAFQSGELDNINISIKKNLSTQLPAKIKFDAHLSNTELLFNTDWQSLKQLDANIAIDGRKITVMVNHTMLNDMFLQGMKVQILDMSKDKLEISVVGKINTQSEILTQFLKDAPLNDNVNDVLGKFSLSGKVVGNVDLIISLDETEPILDINLSIQDNRMTTLGGAIVVKNYDAQLTLHNNKITSKGVGNIRGESFNIRINSNNQDSGLDALFKVGLTNGNNFEFYLTKYLDQTWQANVKSDTLKTDVKIILNENALPEVKLINLQVEALDKIKGNWDIQAKDFPSMHLSVQNIQVGESKWPDFEATLGSQDKVLKIINLEFLGIGVNSQNLSFDGAWVDGRTILTAKAKGSKLSKFLDKLNIKEKVRGGQFEFDIRLFCNCAPWNMSFKGASGLIKMKVKEGVFTNKDPNISRVLSLLNIKSIAKRLELDITDLVSEGFVYDTIDAQVSINNSMATISHFKLDSSSSTINLTGSSNIVKQTYHLEAKVLPAISDAVPITTYLAGGGLSGMVVWLVDKILFKGKLINNIVDKVVEFKYKITGPWNKPIIENISTVL
ncbi:membrane protein-like protein [Candidatus Ruthia magnifica str. Cm (Calyptogena magnifica)]|uniref:Membrane protein-like protein n=2 Tax=Candidatus Ruthturnera TaxID=1541743 RepID=A1AVR0_RUTMC|nr:DUF3971 domain-containing protein [Candidatus Ruthturnera calyptogenae]ABL02017.1 membrane protein-like protein [Candidatus Ruthia magnifica str. Cm (Calyptogena magnifica)]